MSRLGQLAVTGSVPGACVTTALHACHKTSLAASGLKLAGMVLGGFAFLAALYWWMNHEGERGSARVPVGRGRVCGVVGRMGSGKSYFAVRMCTRWLMSGGTVCSNFSLKLDRYCDVKGCGHNDPATCRAAGMQSRWSQFTGWAQFMELKDCLIVLDEAHLYCPSNKTLAFPDDARWKLSMLRKYRCDFFWLSQHERRVNGVLRDLTNMMYVCCSWFGGTCFTVKGYEPENMRIKDKHIDRKLYRINPKVAGSYDTMEMLEADGEHMGKGTRINELAQAHNAERRAARRCTHEQENHLKVGSCQLCHGNSSEETPPSAKGDERKPAPGARRLVRIHHSSDAGGNTPS